MRRIGVSLMAALALAAQPAAAEVPVTLRGSPESMVRQNEVARGQGYAFARTPGDVTRLEREGQLVRLEGNADYELADFVRYAEARPEMRKFIERLAAQYRAATGEKLVVTSLIRPSSRQPGNSHALSVHPTGMAVDLRVSSRQASRDWLESTLLSLERQGLLDITREYSPPHYHVALFPEAYMAHVAALEEEEAKAAREAADRAARLAAEAVAPVASGFSDAAEVGQTSGRDETAARLTALMMVVLAAGYGLRNRVRSVVRRLR